MRSANGAAGFALGGFDGEFGGCLEQVVYLVAPLGGCLHVEVGLQLLTDAVTLFLADQVGVALLLLPEVQLAAHQDEGGALHEVVQLALPLVLAVVQTLRLGQVETHQCHVHVLVRYRPQPVKVFLP